MSNKNIVFTIFILLFYLFSYAQTTTRSVEIKITKDSCIIWDLPEVNFIVQIPADYKISFHSSGGFYFQAHKFKDGNLIGELTFGQLTSSIDKLDLVDMLAVADTEARNQFDEIKQIYRTQFIGIDSIGKNLTIPQLRNYMEFKDFNPNMNGQFLGFTVPIILSDNNKFMFSSMLRVDQKFNEKNIGNEIVKVIESIEMIEK